jgi:tRNA threonylcarbamoyladenosine biosynthesis protein TsaE
MTKRTLANVEEMQQFAADLLKETEPGTVLLLEGELGAGKTTFVQGLARALGVTDTVNSPTFTIAGEYDTKHPTIKRLTHLDLYRLVPDQADREAVVTEALQPDNDELVVIEWADRLLRPPSHSRRLTFELGNSSNERTVTID